MKRTVVVVVALTVYAWAATNARPFSTISYLLVALPSVAFTVAYVAMGGLSPRHPEGSDYYEQRVAETSLTSISPWIAVLLAVVILEAIGLALGGRSADVPTLSTAIDHLLAQHWARWLIYMAWLLAGVMPLHRLRALTQVPSAT